MTIPILLLICQSELFGPQNILQFAEHLYAQEDYAAALHEYRRYLFLSDSVGEEIFERVIECLSRLERYREAVTESHNFNDVNKRNYTAGLIFFTAGEMDSSRTYLNRVTIPYAEEAARLIGLGHAYEFNFREAADYIELPEHKPSYKAPVLGAVLSLLPGGGHFYAGRYGDGLYSFLLVSTASLLAYYYYDRDEDIKFGFSLGAAIVLYAGNIYGGINSVRNYNYYENERYLQEILELK
jgi:hypothetical protein